MTWGAIATVALGAPQAALAQDPYDEDRWAIALHGGAGTIKRDRITPEKDAEIRAALSRALDAGSKILRDGGSAMDAITATILILEDDPNFNAGKGAVFTWDRTNELDASIMDGSNMSAGAAAGVTATKNPILLAKAVKDNSPHVMLSGKGADQFSREQGLEQVSPDYYATPRRLEQIDKFLAKQVSAADVDYKFGTVGAVALDRKGNMAAGTSTGGMTGKRWGRIGDSPVIGAGTYADNRSCAVSATGDGEYFIRIGVAQEICTRLRIAAQRKIDDLKLGISTTAAVSDGSVEDEAELEDMKQTLAELQLKPISDVHAQQIADDVIAEMGGLGGTGGIILATPWGQTIYSFNTPGMYRGRASSEGDASVGICGDE